MALCICFECLSRGREDQEDFPLQKRERHEACSNPIVDARDFVGTNLINSDEAERLEVGEVEYTRESPGDLRTSCTKRLTNEGKTGHLTRYTNIALPSRNEHLFLGPWRSHRTTTFSAEP